VVAIHLAPPAADLTALPVIGAGIRLIPTEQAWYDRISIQYRIHADRMEPAQIQDLGSLIAILLTKHGVGGRRPVAQKPESRPFDCTQPGTINVQAFKAAVLDGIRDQAEQTEPLRWFLANSDEQLKDALASDPAIETWLCSGNQGEDGKHQACFHSLQDLVFQLNQAEQMSVIGPGTCEAWVHVKQHLEKLSRIPVFSLYQGLYGAGLVTNLHTLPASITGSWTATFKDVAGGTAAVSSRTGRQDSKQIENRDYLSGSVLPTRKFSAPSTTSQRPRDSNPVCDVAPALAKRSKQTGNSCTNSSSAIQDEGLTWWDISVAATAPGYSDLRVQSSATGSGQAVSVAKVTRFNAYGMFDLYILGKQDVVNRPYLGLPHLSVGLPFAGSPLASPYFAIGETINLPKTLSRIAPLEWRDKIGTYLPVTVRPLFGWVWNKEFESTAAASSAPSQAYRAFKPQWAIELSFKDIKNAVSILSKGD
jgi:hypothetical protein